MKAAVASFGRPRYVRAATGLLVDAFDPRIRDLLRPVSADAGDGDSRSGSASRSDSLIEFVKTTDLGKLQCLTRSCVDAEDGLPKVLLARSAQGAGTCRSTAAGVGIRVFRDSLDDTA